MTIVHSISDLIGNTPMLKLNKLSPTSGATVFAKLEMYNPSGSVKDRAAFNMIREAEKQGKLKPGATIIEPTSGNTGIGLAMNAAARGYRAILVMPDTMTQERINLLKAYGAEVVLTPGDEKMPGAIRKAEQLLRDIDNSFMPMQFSNGANPDAHRTTSAREIISDMKTLDKPLSAFVATAGTGGTITGIGEVLKKTFPDISIHVVEPKGSPVLSGGKPGKHKLVGTSPGFVPDILNENVYDEIIRLADEDAYHAVHMLASLEGLLVGPSSGAACHAALEVAKRLTPKDIVVFIACDTGERYLSSDLFEQN
ncbi:cysteine synthase A [Bacillaceae bacterium SIJ1]|uniref:cysteine synthase A n=1 Tax=Litoribacterium kuwaitense TaxID=1398745 RepID=UPI0013EB8BF5|nr:cysteine synthase A [Litoribacterium kuwaitense]NGP44216.1 cysteine synthase A [Litoribacterium kuwaitense]